MKKLVTLVLRAMMLFSAVMSVTTLAKTTKCAHPKEVVKVVKKATCTEDGKVTYTCKKCGKLLKTSKVKSQVTNGVIGKLLQKRKTKWLTSEEAANGVRKCRNRLAQALDTWDGIKQQDVIN